MNGGRDLIKLFFGFDYSLHPPTVFIKHKIMSESKKENIFPELGDPDRIRQELIQYLQNKPYPPSGRYSVTDFLNWLEKQGEQMLAWSEEDELGFKQAIYVCHRYGYTDVENWLKTIKDRVQPHWKPTEEQMKALERTIRLANFGLEEDRRKALESILEQLKKL